MQLNDKKLQALKRKPVTGKHTDGAGLYLKISPLGGFYWQWKVRTPRETIVSYGTYPEVSLAEAREKHRQAQAMRRNGVDPNTEKKRTQQAQILATANTFDVLAREWLEVQKSKWSPGHLETVQDRLDKNLLPYLAKRPIPELEAPEILTVLRKIEARGAIETARRCKFIVSQVFRYGIATGRATRNPAQDLLGALQSPAGGHHSAITDPVKLGEMLRSIDGYRGGAVVRAMLRIHALTFQRPNEIRGMRWDELNLDAGEWIIPPERMKSTIRQKISGQPHLVPLSSQAVEVLKDLQPLTGRGALVFPSNRGQGRCASENTARVALRTLGYTNDDHTPHGFRATARTLLDEALSCRVEVIEAQLAHRVRDSLGRAYNRTTFGDERRKMMQTWADYLDVLQQDSVKRKHAANPY